MGNGIESAIEKSGQGSGHFSRLPGGANERMATARVPQKHYAPHQEQDAQGIDRRIGPPRIPDCVQPIRQLREEVPERHRQFAG